MLVDQNSGVSPRVVVAFCDICDRIVGWLIITPRASANPGHDPLSQ
jgi:hypothetical protein